MRTSLFPLMVIIFIGLLGGAAITSNGSPLPLLEQVNNPEASTTVGTGGQYQTLALLVLLIVGSLGGITTAIAGFFYYTNRQINLVGTFASEDGSVVNADGDVTNEPDPFTRMLRENPVMTVAGLALVGAALLFIVALFSGILF